jgi:hypothetical protein
MVPTDMIVNDSRPTVKKHCPLQRSRASADTATIYFDEKEQEAARLRRF